MKLTMPAPTSRRLSILCKICKALLLLVLLSRMSVSYKQFLQLPKRVGNRKRRRDDALQQLSEFSELQFKAQTGLSHRLFNYLLKLIGTEITSNAQKAVNSSGSPVPAEMKLFITMRLLKGGKALDMDWMGADPPHVWSHIWLPVATAIDAALDNVQFRAGDLEWCKKRAAEWSMIQTRKYGANPSAGLIGAVDGLIIKIPHLLDAELKEVDMPWVRFWNRKGYHALNAQVVCDAYCRITSFECRWPGSVNDITAYRQSALYIEQLPLLPPEFYLGLDEAYKSVKDRQHVTPFAGAEIQAAQDQNLASVASAMRLFNKIFCSDRITIERAFGQLVRRWGVLWSAVPRVRLEQIALLLRVCVKLHNLCVDEWLCSKYGYESEEGRLGQSYPVPLTPDSLVQEMEGAGRAGDQPNLPDGDVAALHAASLLDPGAHTALRVDHTEDVDQELPQPSFSSVDPVLNAGSAMANYLDEEVDTRGTNGAVRDATLVLSLNGENEGLESAFVALAERDASAARRLKMTLAMHDLGMSVNESVY